MQINQNSSFSFTQIKKPVNLDKDYQIISNRVTKLIEMKDVYKEAEKKKIDLYVLKPTKKNERFKLAYFDNDMHSFVRDKNNRILVTSATAKEQRDINYYSIMDRISNVLYKIIHKELEAPNWHSDQGKYIDEYVKICKKNNIELMSGF